MIHSIIVITNGKPKSVHCSLDGDKAAAAFTKQNTGKVTWYKMSARGGNVYRQADHNANAAQLEKQKVADEKAERDAAVRAEEERLHRIKQASSDAATAGIQKGLAGEELAAYIAEAVSDNPQENLSPQDKEPGEDASPSEDPGSNLAEESTEPEADADGEDE